MAKKKAVKKATKKKTTKKSPTKEKRKTVKSKKSQKKNTQTFAILMLLLNIFIPLGLGSMLGGKTRAGIMQLLIMILGGLLPYLVGLPILMIGWIWQIITGVQLVQESAK